MNWVGLAVLDFRIWISSVGSSVLDYMSWIVSVGLSELYYSWAGVYEVGFVSE